MISGIGAVTIRTSLGPNHARAFIEAPPSTGLYSGCITVGSVPRYYKARWCCDLCYLGKFNILLEICLQLLAWFYDVRFCVAKGPKVPVKSRSEDNKRSVDVGSETFKPIG